MTVQMRGQGSWAKYYAWKFSTYSPFLLAVMLPPGGLIGLGTDAAGKYLIDERMKKCRAEATA
ncbi:hypothetical protein ACNKHL_09805 [Shigella flexneri]